MEMSENGNQGRGAGGVEGNQEEVPGEEPREVNENGNQRRGVREDHGLLEGPQKVVPETGIGGRMRSIGDPRLPTQAEVDNHNITHVPYRNWCPHCVRGQGKDFKTTAEASRKTAVCESLRSTTALWVTTRATKSRF